MGTNNWQVRLPTKPTDSKTKTTKIPVYQAFRSQVGHAKGIFVFPPKEADSQVTKDIITYTKFTEQYNLLPVRFNTSDNVLLSVSASKGFKNYQLAEVDPNPIRVIENTIQPPKNVRWYFALGSEYILYYISTTNTVYRRIKVTPKLR
jgi:hypothetical protein